MMDGRIGAVRDALDAEGYTDTGIIGATLFVQHALLRYLNYSAV